MTATTTTFDPTGLLIDAYLDTSSMVITGPVEGVWTITVPDAITQEVLDGAVAIITAEWTANANRLALIAKAAAAITNNNAYVVATGQTNVQVAAQVKTLTRQVTALMKLAAEDLSNTTGT